MKPPQHFTQIIEHKLYDVATATLLAGDDYWDGHNFERRGRNMFLYQTPKGAYFTLTLTKWTDEQDELIPIEQDEAIELYERSLTEHRVEYSEAFPKVVLGNANA